MTTYIPEAQPEDLRVGQLVAWIPGTDPGKPAGPVGIAYRDRHNDIDDIAVGTPIGSGTVIDVGLDRDRIQVRHDLYLTRRFWELGGQVFILRDVPPEPVLVRREDFDLLVEAFEIHVGAAIDDNSVLGRVGALINNAQTPNKEGTTP
jgi:hypothetical protein